MDALKLRTPQPQNPTRQCLRPKTLAPPWVSARLLAPLDPPAPSDSLRQTALVEKLQNSDEMAAKMPRRQLGEAGICVAAIAAAEALGGLDSNPKILGQRSLDSGVRLSASSLRQRFRSRLRLWRDKPTRRGGPWPPIPASCRHSGAYRCHRTNGNRHTTWEFKLLNKKSGD